MAQLGVSLGPGHGSLALFLLGDSGLPPVGRCLPLFRAFPFTAARDPGDLIDQKLSLRWRDRPQQEHAISLWC